MSSEMMQSGGSSGAPKGLVERFAERLHVEPNKLLASLKSTVFRQRGGGAPSNEQMLALLVVADQYGLNPLTRELYAFPDDQGGIVPVVSVDGWSRIINGNSDNDGVEFRFSEETVQLDGLERPMPDWCECVVHHKSRSHPTVVREFMDEVYRPPFVSYKTGKTIRGPWQSHPRRMLRHKALIQAVRVAFGYGGIFDADEADRVIEARQQESGVWTSGTASPAPKQGGVDRLRGRLGAQGGDAPVGSPSSPGGSPDAAPDAPGVPDGSPGSPGSPEDANAVLAADPEPEPAGPSPDEDLGPIPGLDDPAPADAREPGSDDEEGS